MLLVDLVCVVRDNFRASSSIPVTRANQDHFRRKLKNFGLCTTRGFRGAQGISFMYVAQSTGLSFVGWLRPCRRPLFQNCVRIFKNSNFNFCSVVRGSVATMLGVRLVRDNSLCVFISVL